MSPLEAAAWLFRSRDENEVVVRVPGGAKRLTLSGRETPAEVQRALEAAALSALPAHPLEVTERARSFVARWVQEGCALEEVAWLEPDEEAELLERDMRAPPAQAPNVLSEILARRGSVIFGGTRTDFAELDARSRGIAVALARARGPVGVCVERSPDLIAALIAVWRAGLAQLPLDPSLPPDRLRDMLEDSGCDVVVCDERGEEAIANFQGRVLALSEIARGGDPPDRTGALAYVLYTSGSTGRPKGVCVSHAAFASFVHAMREEPGLHEHDRVLAVTSIGFDIAGLELYATLAAGGCVVLASREESRDGAALARLIDAHAVTIVQATPSTFRLLLEAPPRRRPRVFCGGEAWSASLGLERLSDEVWNMYGPTETTVWSAVRRVQGEVAIGGPIPGTAFYVLDRRKRLVPDGFPGELHIAGAGLAEGYHRRPQLSAERFFTWRGRRVYASGDLVIRQDAQTLRFLGRADAQVKIRGHRVELGEIEAQLCEHRAIAAAAVIWREERLTAFVEARAPLEAQALRHHLAQTLPEHMLPSRFIQVDNLPLTPAGKIDRRALTERPWPR